jgi:hypothetical protein
LAKKWSFFAQTTASFCKVLIITLVFEKTPFFAENGQKSQKIEIITSPPGDSAVLGHGICLSKLKLEVKWS